MKQRRIIAFFIITLVFGLTLSAGSVGAADTDAVSVDITPGHALNIFDPIRTLGAGVDSQNAGAVANIYTPRNVSSMLASGLGPVSYRLYTELSVQDWHWNPYGRWSDPAGQGYWTGALTSPTALRDTFGYRLPHRGFTHDQGNDDDYSRLDDGNLGSYWKSNPYLARRFTGEADSLHPQWIVIDLGTATAVDAVRIYWTQPYAKKYEVQYWRGPDAINDPANGRWMTFQGGSVPDGDGGTVTIRLSTSPLRVEFVRILMRSSSDTCDSHGARDLRNCVGYAVSEVGLGTLGAHHAFHDLLRHVPNNSQTATYVSSVDPWHAPLNKVTDQEQPGLDIVYHSGLTRGLPAMVAVSMLYGTPGDATAQIEYLESQRDPISYVELGEEPDGQYISPEDYGALYLQWARALHAVDPRLRLGGPVFQGVTQDVQTWPDAHGDVSWLHRFLQYLRQHGRINDLAFMSFEHYPFDACDRAITQNLYAEPGVVRDIVRTWFRDGLPHIPMFITETNYSADAAAVMQDISGALWFADFAGSFLRIGGAGAFLYQYEPEPLVTSASSCTTYGAWGMFAGTDNNQIRYRTSQFFAAQMLMQQWAQPIDSLHALFPTDVHGLDLRGPNPVRAYALLRPDGQWAVLAINDDPAHSHVVSVVFHNAASSGPVFGNAASGGDHFFRDPVSVITFGAAQYQWHPDGPNGFPNPDGPTTLRRGAGGKNAVYELDRASITVLRGRVR